MATRRAAVRLSAVRIASLLAAIASITLSFAPLFAPGLAIAQEFNGPSIAVKLSSGHSPQVDNKGFPSALISDLTVTYTEACKGRIAEWIRRQDVLDELALQQSRFVNPATRADTGQLIQPDYFVETELSGDGNRFEYTVSVVDAVTQEVVVTEKGSTQHWIEAEEQIAKSLPEKLCKLSPGFQMKGRMDEATVNGKICGKTDEPFTATSPEVAGSWRFTPKSEVAGSFTYTAKNIGGVPGSGKGTYIIVKGANGGATLKLSGTGMVHSPMGDFSAAITESIELTPLKTCGRVGSK